MAGRIKNQQKGYYNHVWLLKVIDRIVIAGVEQPPTYAEMPIKIRCKRAEMKGLTKESQQILQGFINQGNTQIIQTPYWDVDSQDLILNSLAKLTQNPDEAIRKNKSGIVYTDFSKVLNVQEIVLESDNRNRLRMNYKGDTAYLVVIS